jgi:hypothetical protein
MSYNYQPLDIQDFTGGMTDDYINASPNMSQVLENFYILNNKTITTRPGTILEVATNADAQIPLGTERIGGLFSHEDYLFVQATNRIYYRNPTAYTQLLGPESGVPFADSARLTVVSHAIWNRHLILSNDAFDKPIKIYKDDAGVFQLRTAGLPTPASSPVVTAGAAGSSAFTYAFHYQFTYMVEDQEFVDAGPVVEVELTAAANPDSNAVAISAIPVLANAIGDNYDTANIKVAIFRTINGGTVLFKVAEVANGVTTYNDSLSDTLLQDNETIYTSGDVPDNDPPPPSKYVHTVNGVTYWAHFTENGQTFPNKFKQSQYLDPDSVPGSFEDEVEDKITGLSSVQDVPIIGCRKFIYRVDGIFDENGRGGMTHKRISDHAGCISNDSFVQAEGALFWAGVDGFYYTDGFRVLKITDHLNKTYASFIANFRANTNRIKGVYNPITRMIHWTFSSTPKGVGQEECDILWSVDLQWGISQNMPFHIWKGSERFQPSAIAFHLGNLYRGDKTGFVLKFDPLAVTDPKIDATVNPEDWVVEPIIWLYRSISTNFGTSFVRKIANKLLISAKNISNVSIAATAINDNGKLFRELEPIRWRKNFMWGDDEFYWGNPLCTWSYGGLIESDRRLPSGGLRFDYLQLELTNSFTNIVNSDSFGLTTIDATAKTATLVDLTKFWPTQAVDYYLYFENDNYVKGFKIIERVSDTVVLLSDIHDEMTSGVSQKWQIKGYKKGEILNLLGYNLSWAMTSRSHEMFNLPDRGTIAPTEEP